MFVEINCRICYDDNEGVNMVCSLKIHRSLIHNERGEKQRMNKAPCTIYDCEWAWYYDGVILGDTVFLAHPEEGILPTKEISWLAWDTILPLMQFYTGTYNKDGEHQVQDTAKWGYFNLFTGKIVAYPEYDFAYPYYGDMARVVKNKKYGFLNRDGKRVVDLIWDDASCMFIGNLSPVRTGSGWGYIDKQGNVIIEPTLDEADQFVAIRPSGYAARVKVNDKYGFINDDGEYIFEPKFDGANRFWSCGYAPVAAYGKWGFIDTNGYMAVPLQFDDVGRRNNRHEMYIKESSSYYTVNIGGIWGILDEKLNIYMPQNGERFVIHGDKKIYIKNGEITSTRKLKRESLGRQP